MKQGTLELQVKQLKNNTMVLFRDVFKCKGTFYNRCNEDVLSDFPVSLDMIY